MIPKSILIVCRSFEPSISPRSFRATELAKELVRLGHKVKVITPLKEGTDYKTMGRNYRIQFKDIGPEKFRILKLTGNKVIVLFKRIINRTLLMFIEYPDIQYVCMVNNSLRDENDHDLLISVAAPHPIHWGVASARKNGHKIAHRWIADCGDPYMGDRIDTFRKFFYFRYIEKYSFRKADFITIPIEEARNAYYEEFHPKIHIIPQGFDLSGIRIPGRFEPNIPVTFAYAGGFSPGMRDPRSFLEIISNIDIDFRFIVFTKKNSLIEPYRSRLGEKLILRDYIPRNELLPFLSTMDFLVNFDNNTDIHKPSKLIDYALTQRPVLNIARNTCRSVVIEFLNRNYTQKLKTGDISQYDIREVARKFLDLASQK